MHALSLEEWPLDSLNFRPTFKWLFYPWQFWNLIALQLLKQLKYLLNKVKEYVFINLAIILCSKVWGLGGFFPFFPWELKFALGTRVKGNYQSEFQNVSHNAWLFSLICKLVLFIMNLRILILSSLVLAQKMLLLLELLVSGWFRFNCFPSSMLLKHHCKGMIILLLIQEVVKGNVEYMWQDFIFHKPLNSISVHQHVYITPFKAFFNLNLHEMSHIWHIWKSQFQRSWYACSFHSWLADCWCESFGHRKIWGIPPGHLSTLHYLEVPQGLRLSQSVNIFFKCWFVYHGCRVPIFTTLTGRNILTPLLVYGPHPWVFLLS